MKIKLLKFETQGLRCPDFNFNYEETGQKRINFLQMPNGTGKTTTLDLLRASFYEKKWSSREIENLKRSGSDTSNGHFRLQIKYINDIYWIEINFDFKNLKYSYFTTKPEGGKRPGFDLPSKITNIIDENFIKLLFFDAEWAEDLFKSNSTRATKNIYDFCRLGIVDKFSKHIDDYYSDQQKKFKVSQRDQNKLQALLSKEKIIHSKIDKISKQLKTTITKLDKDTIKFNELELEINKYLQDSQDKQKKIDDANLKYQQAENNYKEQLKSNLDIHKKYFPILNISLRDDAEKFINSLDVLKLPEADARAFFEELIKGGECICGEHLDEEKIQIILRKKDEFLSEKTATEMNTYKNSLRYLVKEEIKDFSIENDKISELKAEYESAYQDLSNVKKFIFADNPEIEKKQNQKNKLQDNIASLKKFISDTKENWSASDTPESTNSLTSLQKQLDYTQENIAKITEVEKILKKKNKINSILKIAIDQTVKSLSQELTKECNEKISKLLQPDPLYLSDIQDTLIIKGRKKGDRASVGQMARIGYIFITTLLEKSNFIFPLVIDSPVAGMEHAGRRGTADLLSKLNNQITAFVLDAEKVHFTHKLKELCPNDLLFTTLYRQNDQTKFLDSKLPELTYKSSNGTVVYDEKFFDIFDIEEIK